MKKIFFLLLLQVMVLFLFAQQKTIAIRCGKLLDARSGKVLINQIILVFT